MRKFCLLSLLFFVIGSADAVDPPKKEMRGVWLTTLYALDWPRKPASSGAACIAQQNELCTILDRLYEANFNTVFLQVRLRGDVIWRSAIEPVSKVFSGKYGVMPAYDPLAFAIEECHKRGMDCHAWFVTFPVGSDVVVKEQGKLATANRQRKLCKRFNGEWYLDPGVPGTTDYILSLVKELVSGYDIDGIHFDYIRYPEKADLFPDKAGYKTLGKGKAKAEWRRENINNLVCRIYDNVKRIKPWLIVSSSPLGKYTKVDNAPDMGWTAYGSVYQDPVEWMRRGKHDMIVPMMYYRYDNFFPYLDNWAENSAGRLVVPGLAPYRLERQEGDWSLNDITDQIDYSRYYGGSGNVFFRCTHVLNNMKGLYDELLHNYYKYPAQQPALTWLSDKVPEAPGELKVRKNGSELELTWRKPSSANALSYTVYYSLSDSVDLSSAKSILATGIRDTVLYLSVPDSVERGYLFRVSSSDRYHIESKPSPETYYYLSNYPK